MGKLTIANLKKTLYYLQRNGLRNTWNAARERLGETENYQPKAYSEEELQTMRQEVAGWFDEADANGAGLSFFSILVPAYRTNPKFLKELVESVGTQVYPNWELLIMDASGEENLQDALSEICKEAKLRFQVVRDNPERQPAREGSMQGLEKTGGGRYQCSPEYVGVVRYLQLTENAGISENTNAGLPYVTGDYVGLLDHDDVLTPDALYEMAEAIRNAEEAPEVLYSDEDKWDGESRYYECNRKEDFNLDLLLSNNYICHFLVMKAELFKELGLRREFDGAQDYDLVLRATGEILKRGEAPEKRFYHVPEVLYHWRCHQGSTAENPKSKLYAYEAGRRALQDFADSQGWHAKAENLKHVGFYRLRFESVEELFRQRPDVGAVGGKILQKAGKAKADDWKILQKEGKAKADDWKILQKEGKAKADDAKNYKNAGQGMVLAGGRMAEDGSVYYEGLKESFTGYLHRGVLTQDAEAVDIRCIIVPEEVRTFFETIVGVPYVTKKLPSGDEIFDAGTLPDGADIKNLSLAFCKLLRDTGKRILWDPEIIFRL